MPKKKKIDGIHFIPWTDSSTVIWHCNQEELVLQLLNTNQEKGDGCNVRSVWQQIRTGVWGCDHGVCDRKAWRHVLCRAYFLHM